MQSGEYGERVCKIEDSHRHKTEKCTWYSYNREQSCCTEFSAGLGASGEIGAKEGYGEFYFCFGTVLRAKKAIIIWTEKAGRRERRVAVVEAWQNEWGDQCYCSLGRKTLRDTSESAKLVATGSGGLINAGFHGQYMCCRGRRRCCWRSEWDCAIVKLKAVDGQRMCYRTAERC